MSNGNETVTGKTVADDVLDAPLICKLELSYNVKTGQFDMKGNVRDEVLTMGVLHTALDRMKEFYNLERLKSMQDKAENGIIQPGVVN